MITGDFFGLALDRASTVSIGVFDGVHRGHQHLLRQAAEAARQIGGLAVAITFDPRPREVLRPDLPSEYLTTLDERIGLLGELGFDCVPVLAFTREVAAVPAEEFARLLSERYRMTQLWVGPDFALGRGRGGTIPVLRELGGQLGYTVHVVDPLALDGQLVSSTLVHQRLAEGDVAGAAALLGRRPTVTGPVVRGAGRGRTIGLPTANVATPGRIALPANGVYAVYCEVLPRPEPGRGAPPRTGAEGGEGRLLGAASIGTRPTFDDGARALEVHLLDFAGDLYGAELRVEFVERLRPEVRFPSVAALLEEVQRDIAAARRLL